MNDQKMRMPQPGLSMPMPSTGQVKSAIDGLKTLINLKGVLQTAIATKAKAEVDLIQLEIDALGGQLRMHEEMLRQMESPIVMARPKVEM